MKCSVVDLWAPFMVFWAPACLDSFPSPAHLRGLDWSLAVTHPVVLGSPWQLKLHLHQQPPQTSLQGLQPFYPVPGLSYSPWPHLAFKLVTPLAVNLRCSLGHLWSTASVCWFWKKYSQKAHFCDPSLFFISAHFSVPNNQHRLSHQNRGFSLMVLTSC